MLRALARDRGARTPSARALAEALDGFLAARGTPVGLSQLADLVAETFPDELAEKEAWVARARERAPLEPVAEPEAVEPTVSEVRATQVAAAEPLELPVRRTGSVAAIGAAVVLAAAAGFGVVLALAGDEEADRAAPPEEASAPAPPRTEPSGPTEPVAAPTPDAVWLGEWR
ncbi:MAG TPA: hypothetical protein RMH99_32565 [Sandaracinaceae bacterium LLY-WYZ-13_1]|nr:hypothetical protein [Sandaracinaceae bacterium LLY-WYZ-13_1]